MSTKGSKKPTGSKQYPFSDRALAVEAGRKGGRAPRKPKPGPLELGALESHEDAKRWLSEVGQAVVLGHITPHQGQACIRAISEWVKTASEEMTQAVVNDLASEVARLKRELGTGKPRVVR